ncbi:hypothetical protein PENTCL1PPCAC_16748, partial [Pristionchus entomophagus]
FMISVLVLTAVTLHPLVSYVILFQSKSMSADMRAGYLILQVAQVVQDIFFCLLYQPYLMTPLPAIGCMGLLCDSEWLPPVKLLGIFVFLMNGSIVIYLSVLLHIQQALIPGKSRVQISPRSQCLVVLTLSVYTLWVVSSYFISTSEPTNRTQVIQQLNLSWVEQYSRHIVVFGEAFGDSGTFRTGEISSY